MQAREQYFSVLDKLINMQINRINWSNFLKSFLNLMSISTNFEYVAFASVKNNEFCVLEGESTSFLLNEKHKTLDIELSGTVLSWVFRNESPVFHNGSESQTPRLYNNKQANFKALMCVPVFSEKQFSACIIFASNSPKEIDEELKSFVRLACDILNLYLDSLAFRYKMQHKSINQI